MHPLTAQRLDLWRLKNFNGARLPSAEDTYLFHVVAKDNPNDERLIAMAEVRDATPLTNAAGEVVGFPTVERLLTACIDSLRRARAQLRRRRPARPQPDLPVRLAVDRAAAVASWRRFARYDRAADGRRRRRPDRAAGPAAGGAGRASRGTWRCASPTSPGTGVGLRVTDRPTEPMAPLDDYTQKVLRSRARGLAYPYELAPLRGRAAGHLRRVRPGRRRPAGPGRPAAGHQQGRRRRRPGDTPTPRYPEGMTRVALFGDPTKALGTVAVPECALSSRPSTWRRSAACRWSGSRCRPAPRSRWTAAPRTWTRSRRALRRIIEFTQAGGEINVVVAGINVGAQPYWNAEATMLMHTKGILVMTPDSAMVLTGKHSLDYSGGVSAEDNFGLGGYDRVMGPNGQAQYWAPNLSAAVRAPVPALRPRLRRPGRAVGAAGRDLRPAGPGRAGAPAQPPGQRVHHGRRRLLRDGQPGPEEAVRHPDGDARGRPTRTTRRWSGGPAWPTPTPRSWSTRTSAGTR